MWVSPLLASPAKFQELQQTQERVYQLANAHAHLIKIAGKAELSYGLAGRLILSKSGWGLLEVPNALVRGAFDALQEPGIELPTQTAGNLNAHISVLRPEDIEQLGGPDKLTERGHVFHYTLGAVRSVAPASWDGVSRVWFIEIRSPELEKLRKSYGLTPLPHNDKHPFHITVAIRRQHVLKENDINKAAAISGQHTLITGYSGAGKSTLARQLAAQSGMPLIELDRAPEFKQWFEQNPEIHNWEPGSPVVKSWHDIQQQVAHQAIQQKEPHIIEGAHLIDAAPKLLLPQHRLLVDTPELQVVRQRLMRDRMEALAHPESGWHGTPGSTQAREQAALIRRVIEIMRPGIAAYRDLPGTRVIPRAKVNSWLKQAAADRVRVVMPYDGGYLLEELHNPKYPQNLGKTRFPGGGVEPGETPEQAAVRELREELGAKIKPTALQFMGSHQPLNREHKELYYKLLRHKLKPGQYKATVGGDELVHLVHGQPEGEKYFGADLKTLQPDKAYHVAPSTIHGQGVFAARDLRPGDYVGHALSQTGQTGNPQQDYPLTELGRFINHGPARVRIQPRADATYHLVAAEPIKRGEEMTSDYGELRRLGVPTIIPGEKQASDGSATQPDSASYVAGPSLTPDATFTKKPRLPAQAIKPRQEIKPPLPEPVGQGPTLPWSGKEATDKLAAAMMLVAKITRTITLVPAQAVPKSPSAISLPVIGHYRPGQKVGRDAFLYFDPSGSDQANFGQCKTCRAFTGKSCMLFAMGNTAAPLGSCGLYQPGTGDPTQHGKELGVVTKKEAGYVERPVRCENCAYFDDDKSYCELFERLNEQYPSVFALEEKVAKLGCCNAQVARVGAKVKETEETK